MKIKYWDETKNSTVQLVSTRSVKIGEFRDCSFTGICPHYPQILMRSQNELLLPTIERFMSLGRGTVYEETMEWEPPREVLKQHEDSPVFFFCYNTANYFHWLYDTVPYLFSYFKLKSVLPNLKLLMSPPEGKIDLYPFVYETLSLLGIKETDIVFVDNYTKYDKVFVGSSLTHNRLSLEPPHPALWDIIKKIKSPVKDTPKKVYVSRRTWVKDDNKNIGTDYTIQRKCVNEDSVVDLFKKNGFVEVFAEDLSMSEKVSTFANADVVAGPIGGGMANLLFSNKDTKVISINSPEFFPTNERLKNAMLHTDITFFDDTKFVDRVDDKVTHQNALSISGGLNSPWEVDINKLETLLQSVLN